LAGGEGIGDVQFGLMVVYVLEFGLHHVAVCVLTLVERATLWTGWLDLARLAWARVLTNISTED